MDDFQERVRAVVVDTLGVSDEKVTLNVELDDLGADSLDIIDIALTLEDEFNVDLSNMDFTNTNTVTEMAAVIRKAQST